MKTIAFAFFVFLVTPVHAGPCADGILPTGERIATTLIRHVRTLGQVRPKRMPLSYWKDQVSMANGSDDPYGLVESKINHVRAMIQIVAEPSKLHQQDYLDIAEDLLAGFEKYFGKPIAHLGLSERAALAFGVIELQNLSLNASATDTPYQLLLQKVAAAKGRTLPAPLPLPLGVYTNSVEQTPAAIALFQFISQLRGGFRRRELAKSDYRAAANLFLSDFKPLFGKSLAELDQNEQAIAAAALKWMTDFATESFGAQLPVLEILAEERRWGIENRPRADWGDPEDLLDFVYHFRPRGNDVVVTQLALELQALRKSIQSSTISADASPEMLANDLLVHFERLFGTPFQDLNFLERAELQKAVHELKSLAKRTAAAPT